MQYNEVHIRQVKLKVTMLYKTRDDLKIYRNTELEQRRGVRAEQDIGVTCINGNVNARIMKKMSIPKFAIKNTMKKALF